MTKLGHCAPVSHSSLWVEQKNSTLSGSNGVCSGQWLERVASPTVLMPQGAFRSSAMDPRFSLSSLDWLENQDWNQGRLQNLLSSSGWTTLKIKNTISFHCFLLDYSFNFSILINTADLSLKHVALGSSDVQNHYVTFCLAISNMEVRQNLYFNIYFILFYFILDASC